MILCQRDTLNLLGVSTLLEFDIFTCGATAKDMFAYILLMHLVRCWQLRFLRNRNVIQLCWCGWQVTFLQVNQIYMYWFKQRTFERRLEFEEFGNCNSSNKVIEDMSPAHRLAQLCNDHHTWKPTHGWIWASLASASFAWSPGRIL